MTLKFSKHLAKERRLLTAALNERHLGWHFLSLIMNSTAPTVIKNPTFLRQGYLPN